MENIEMLLNELEDELARGRKTLIGNSVVINGTACADIILRIKSALPESLSEAEAILGQTDAIKREAQQKAAEILREARQKADKLIEESEIVKQAEEEAEIIRSQAAQQKDKADYAARRRVDELLEATENSVAEALMVIRNEREEIWGGIKKKQL